jgi:ring-1,2-phenylacetyl-CoA epoxidase subunit PaaC
MKQEHIDFILMMADNNMILGQRLGEWCGHGPVLEQDIALTNIALDLIGEARLYYQYVAQIEGKKEDDYPMLRTERKFKNCLLVEQPNGHWGDSIMRQFMYDCYHYHLLFGLCNSREKHLSDIAQKCIKEANYHLTFSSNWVIRLGDGTDESKQKIQNSYKDLIPFWGEMFEPTIYETVAIEDGVCPNLNETRIQALEKFKSIITASTLQYIDQTFSHSGGKTGIHSEHLGYILTEMQYLQRTYPGVAW